MKMGRINITKFLEKYPDQAFTIKQILMGCGLSSFNHNCFNKMRKFDEINWAEVIIEKMYMKLKQKVYWYKED